MNRIKNSLIAFGGLSILIAAITLVSPKSTISTPAPGAVPVKVINTPSNPVPTIAQGTTTVVGNVSVTGNVGINPSANTVKVENSATPLLVQNVGAAPLRQPVVYFGSQALPAGQFEITAPAFTVPSGKRWVIEYINLEANAPGDYGASVFLQAPFGSSQISYNLLTTHNDAPLGILVSQEVKIYVDAGQTQLRFRRNPPAGPETIFNFVISGYLEPAD